MGVSWGICWKPQAEGFCGRVLGRGRGDFLGVHLGVYLWVCCGFHHRLVEEVTQISTASLSVLVNIEFIPSHYICFNLALLNKNCKFCISEMGWKTCYTPVFVIKKSLTNLIWTLSISLIVLSMLGSIFCVILMVSYVKGIVYILEQ